ncbi:usherin [Gadus chalcogrammus]|nr:usherin [Gadus chalcogrammus]
MVQLPPGPSSGPGGVSVGGDEGADGGPGPPMPVHKELWFAVVMAAVFLVLLAMVLGLVLKALSRPPFTRERPPLVSLPQQKRNRIAVYPPSSSVLFDTAGFSNNVTLKGFTMHAEEILDIKCEVPPSELGVLSVSTVYGSAHIPSQNSLRRSVSQALDGKSLADDSDVWDPHVQGGHDSGLFMEDEEFVDTIKGFSTVRKEHTMFTDTNL